MTAAEFTRLRLALLSQAVAAGEAPGDLLNAVCGLMMADLVRRDVEEGPA